MSVSSLHPITQDRPAASERDPSLFVPPAAPHRAFGSLVYDAVILVAITALIVIFSSDAFAGVVLPDPVAYEGSSDQANHGPQLPLTLVSQRVDVTIVDQVATTELVQVFRNDSDSPVAGTYTLPLSERASIQEYAFWVGGRRVVSSVKAKDQAKQQFDGAQQRGEHASLVEHKDPNAFTARFTELGPGELRRFEVIYSELLPYAAGTVQYSHPLDYASMGLPPVEELEVTVRVSDGKPIVAMRSASHPVDTSVEGDVHVAHYGATDVVSAADFVTEYDLQSSDFGLTFRTYQGEDDDEGYFVAMVAPQEEAGDDAVVRKDIAFVFDVSGSMSGSKMSQARTALDACLSLMNPDDGVYVVAFNDGLNPWKANLERVDEQVRGEAKTFTAGLNSGGGTNIRDAVVSTLRTLSSSERPTALVFLTDGVGRMPPEQVLAEVQANNPDGRTRIFTFGVGDDVNAAFLERLGRENRGGFTHIRGDIPIDETVRAFYSNIARPVLTELALDFGAVTPTRTYPSITPDVYAGQRLVLTGRYRGAGETTLTVSGRIGGEARSLVLPVTLPAQDDEHPWVGRLWAKRRADALLADIRMYGETQEAKEEIVRLSEQWSFATPYTSLVAHADPRVASLTPARIKPGDPVLAIPAPVDSVSVTAFLPFGEVKDLVIDPLSGLWTTRFLVPRSAKDGVYWIHVVATDDLGQSEWFKLSYTVDTLAPVLQVNLDGGQEGRDGPGSKRLYRAGDFVELDARPVVGFLELGAEMVRALGRDAAARAKAFVDVKRVVVRLSGANVETELLSQPGASPGWRGRLELPADLAPGTYQVEVTATDVAGNRHTVVEPLEVGPALWSGAM